MAKPSIDVSKTQWASSDVVDPISGQDNKVEQSATKKTNGWVYEEKPPFNWFNYWMNVVYLYLTWIVDEVIEGTFTFLGNKTFSGTITSSNSTDTSSKDTGAVILEGGIGVEKKIHSGLEIVTDTRFENNNTENNTILGVNALVANTTGVDNTAIGYESLKAHTIGARNCAFGDSALYTLTTGTDHCAFGHSALYNQLISAKNCAFGNYAMYSNTGGFMCAFGHEAMYNNTSGNNNNAFGYQALYSNTSGTDNNAFGYQALYSNTTGGIRNNAFGHQALNKNTTGNNNCAYGYRALYDNTIGFNSNAFGNYALTNNTTGSYNDAFGFDALGNNTIGQYNIAMGYDALYANTTGAGNIAIGYQAGNTNTVGTYNTYVGYDADGTANNLSNSMALGNGASVDTSNKVVIGNASVSTIGGYANWTNYSDRRIKKEIEEIKIGLDFLKKLSPISYITDNNLKRREGFIAQEVEKIDKDFGAIIRPDNSEKLYGLVYSEFIPRIVLAIQELDIKIEKIIKGE